MSHKSRTSLAALPPGSSGTRSRRKMSGETTLKVYYIRHGQSQWNAAQTQYRREEMPEDDIKALGRQEYFTDSPLSKKGVEQALALQRRLFDKRTAHCGPAASRTLAEALACTVRLKEPLPVFLTSNLRRAIDTTLVALRPLVERGRDVIVLPALQETCRFADCVPSPRQPASLATGRGPLELASNEGIARNINDLVQRKVLAAQLVAREAAEKAERYGSGAGLTGFVNAAYLDRLAVAPHTLWDDRRSVPDGFEADPSPAAISAQLAPFLARLGDIVDAMLLLSASTAGLEAPAAAAAAAAAAERAEAEAARSAVVIGAHSRLLRELLYAFLSGQQLSLSRLHLPQEMQQAALCTGSGAAARCAAQLEWDASTNVAECAALASQQTRLSNTGAISFDLQLHAAAAQAAGRQALAAGAAGAAAGLRLTLANCRLDAGAKVCKLAAPWLAPPSTSPSSSRQPSASQPHALTPIRSPLPSLSPGAAAA